jgi:bacteriocin biosynthesis cyclodehydratase domain-containing protein
VLPVAVRPGRLDIGPLLDAPDGLCGACTPSEGEPARLSGAAAGLAAGLVGGEALALLGVGTPRSRCGLVRVDLVSLRAERLTVTPRPGCAHCGTVAAGDPGALEWLARSPKPVRAQKPAVPEGRNTSPRRRPDTHLAALLAAAHGPAARDAPDLYVVADEPGVFAYDHARRELVAVAAGGPSVAELLALAELPAGADAAVIVVAPVGRLFAAYGGLAFRVAHLHAGAAVARLHAAHDGETAIATSWDGRLADALELRTEHEIVAAVLALGERPCR